MLYMPSLLIFALPNFTIRFATDATYAPFESIDDNNNIIGFDIDIVNIICSKINVNCTFTHQSFDSLIISLKMHRFDALVSGIDITPDRQKQVDFTDIYYKNSTMFIVSKKKINKISLLEGKKIGVQNGTTHQKYIIQQHKEMKVVPYDNYQLAILDLQNGRIDAMFGDSAVITKLLKTKGNKNLISINEKITDLNYFGIGLGIAVRKGNKILLDKLNKALIQIKQDGSYDAIYKKWL
ncbi:MAG: arginine ABC transporter substrate-binding protein [Arsenophonus endosymbiont of Ceratovacuna japonica]